MARERDEVPGKKNRGRFTKLTQELHDRIVPLISAGTPLKHAAKACGISDRSLGYWLRIGRAKPNSPHGALFSAIEKARSERIAECVARIVSVGRGGLVTQKTTTIKPDGTEIIVEKKSTPEWTALAWFLERTDPENFSSDRKVISELKQLIKELSAQQKK